jgi:nardilysin
MPKRRKIKAPPALLAAKRCKASDAVDRPFVKPKAKFKMSKVKVLPSPEKSENDKKEYRVIQLENGLKCLLISDLAYPLDKLDQEEDEDASDEDEEEEDEDEDEGESDGDDEDGDDDPEDGRPGRPAESTGLKLSAAGLMVHMGSFSDPEDIPGLAHFLEHMVFMGSKKYPDENGFDSFIAKHGGYDNASTDTETTVFYFESPRRNFEEALDRFAQFFIAPLMAQNAMEREREAVDSEFQMALPSDSNRLCQVMVEVEMVGDHTVSGAWRPGQARPPDGKVHVGQQEVADPGGADRP